MNEPSSTTAIVCWCTGAAALLLACTLPAAQTSGNLTMAPRCRLVQLAPNVVSAACDSDGTMALPGPPVTAAKCTAGEIPDPVCTPGVVNPDVTQDNIDSTICVPGYTKTIRPPASYTNALKRQQMVEYGIADDDLRDYEEDHDVPLEIGGHPTDPHNLRPQPRRSITPPPMFSAEDKDKLENIVKRMICSHTILLPEGQAVFFAPADWRRGYCRYVDPGDPRCGSLPGGSE